MKINSIHTFAIIFLLAAFCFQGIWFIFTSSLTFDEPFHISSGWSYWKFKDYRMNPEHPPLIKYWCSLPLLFMNLKISQDTDWQKSNEWEFGHRFFSDENKNKHILILSRIMNLVLGILGGIILYFFAQNIFSKNVSLIILALYCFNPEIITHSSLVTMDFANAFFYLMTIYGFFLIYRKKDISGKILFVLGLCGGHISKHSFIIIVPLVFLIMPLLLFFCYKKKNINLFVNSGENNETIKHFEFGKIIIIILISILSIYISIWAIYGFKYKSIPLGVDYLIRWENFESNSLTGKTIKFLRNSQLLPEAYIYGWDFLLKHEGRPGFIWGKILSKGVWYYFPSTFILKTPFSLLIIFISGSIYILFHFFKNIILQIKFILPENYKKLKTNLFYLDVAIFIFLPVIYYFLFYIIFIRLNIGNRHILPVYPFVFLFAGFIFQELIKRKIKILSSAIYLIFTLYFIEVLSIAPSYLSFVNILGGGVNNGWKNISDSNYDWGQDFKKLLKWSSQKGNPQINLAYFGNENPEHSNLNYILLPSFRSFTIKSKELQQISNVYLKGYFAISTNHLVGTYLEDFNLGFNPYEYFKHKKPTYKAGTSIIIFKEDESTSKTLLDAAIETYHKKIEKDPDEGDNYSSLASALLLKGEKLEKVINLFYSAIEKNPQNINNYIVLANIFSNTGKLYDAIKIYEKVLISDKNNYLVYNRIGDTYLKLGDIHRAFEYFQKTVEIAPGYFIGWHNFAISAIRLNDLYNAKSAIRKAENIDPDSHMVSNLWGLFYTKKNDRKNAIKFFKNACDKNPNYTFSYINLGELLLEEGRTTEALETFRKINKIPNNVGKISFQE